MLGDMRAVEEEADGLVATLRAKPDALGEPGLAQQRCSLSAATCQPKRPDACLPSTLCLPPTRPAAGLTKKALDPLPGSPPAIPDRILQREALKSFLYGRLNKHVWNKPSTWFKVRAGSARRSQHLLCCRLSARMPVLAASPGNAAGRPPSPQGYDSMNIEACRALRTNFDNDTAMAKAQAKVASNVSAELGLPSRSYEAALGEEGTSALSHLVATAMKAQLQMSGSGRDHRITVGASSGSGQLRPLNGGRHNVRTCVSPQAPFSEVPLSSLGTISVLLTCRPGVVAQGAGAARERVVLQEEVVATGQARAAVVHEEAEGVAGVQPAHVVLTMGEGGSGGQAAAR
jgi:hypothetical protein